MKKNTPLIKTPPEHWEDIRAADPGRICRASGALCHPRGFILRFLTSDLLLDTEAETIFRLGGAEEKKVVDPLLSLTALVYLLRASGDPLRNEKIGVKELKDAHFFSGPHEFQTGPVLSRFGRDAEGFAAAAVKSGGSPLDMADSAYCFFPFPRVPIYLLLWEGDEEFPPGLNILFDRSIESYLPADAIWGAVNLVLKALLESFGREE
jgi:hypothetical protein